MKMFQSATCRWLFILLMFLPLFKMNFIGIGFFAMKTQYFAAFYLVWLTAYLAFWFILGCIIHIVITDKFNTISDFLIIIPTVGGDPIVILSGGLEYKKVGEGRPQEYTVCDSKAKDINLITGIVFNALPTDKKLQLREIDVIDQISNKLYIRGYLEYDEDTKTYHNHLDLSSLPAQMSLLSLELKAMSKTKDGVERLYERSFDKLIAERKSALENQGDLAELFSKTLEATNTVTGKFSGTTNALENRKVDAKLGSDKKVNAMIDEKMKEIKESIMAQMTKK